MATFLGSLGWYPSAALHPSAGVSVSAWAEPEQRVSLSLPERGMHSSSSQQHPGLEDLLLKRYVLQVLWLLVSQGREEIYSSLSISSLIYFLNTGNLAGKNGCSRAFEKHHLRSMCLARLAQVIF